MSIRDLFTSSVNSTVMSINERFTYLQKNARPVQTPIMKLLTENSARELATAKKVLAMQMERLSALAALKLKKKSIRQRLGLPLVVVGRGSNVRDRLSLPARGGARQRNSAKNRRNRGRSLRRSQSMQSLQGGNLQRSRSMQSINNGMTAQQQQHRSRSRSRNRIPTPTVGPKEMIASQRRSLSGVRQGRLQKTINTGFFHQQVLPPQRRRRSNSINFRNRRPRNMGNRGIQKDERTVIFKRGGGKMGRNVVGGNFQSIRGQGQFRGRPGRGRGIGQPRNLRITRNNKPGPVPTKEELDKELEQYMANTKSQLDKDIDTYMKENNDPDAMEIWG